MASVLDIDPRKPPSLEQLRASREGVRFQGRLLACDFACPLPLHCHVDASGAVSAFFQLRHRCVPARSCDLIAKGPPHYFISGFALRLIDEELDWHWIAKAREGSLHAEELKRAAKERDEGAPCVAMDAYRGPELLPGLRLKDRRGAFAELLISGEPFTPGMGPDHCAFERDLIESGYRRHGSQYTCPLDRVSETLTFLLELGWTVQDSAGRILCLQSGQDLRLLESGDRIELEGSLHFGEGEAAAKSAIESLQRGEMLLPLDKVRVALLPQSLAVIPMRVDADRAYLPRCQFGELRPFLGEEGIEVQTDLFDDSRAFASSDAFVGELRPYQREGVAWLQNLFRQGFHGLLADDMGLGKTVQVLAFLASLESSHPHLVVAPSSLLFNWQREAERFVPAMRVHLYHGPGRSLESVEPGHIVITSYDLLRRDELLRSLRYCAVILDEAQVIKNKDSQVSQAACALASTFRLSVTGTPVENHAGELFSHFRFLQPDLLGSQAVSLSLDTVGRRIQPFLLRRKKSDVAKELPPRIEQTILVEPSEEEREVCRQLLARSRALGASRMQQLETILRLRQACCHPLLISGHVESDLPSSSKLSAVLEDLETAIQEGKKVLVYSQFTSMLTLLERAFVERGWPRLRLDGKTRERERIVDEFQEGSVQLLLLSLKVGGVGLTLSAAETVFIYEPWWNDAAEAQAIDRAHRIGQDRCVMARRYVVCGSIEERMMQLKRKKKALGEKLLSAERFSEEDLLFLLQG